MHNFGGPEVLNVEDLPIPKPNLDEVLIEVRAVSVNRTLDCMVREGKYSQIPNLPHILGCDPSGVICAVGANVTDRKIGDHVVVSPVLNFDPKVGAQLLGVAVWGGCCQFISVPARITFQISPEIDFGVATVIARHSPLAYTQLIDHAQLMPDEWVLVMGAAGGLGSAAVQVAKSLGAKVIGAAGSDTRVELATKLGADFGVNYRKKNLSDEVSKITDGNGVNVVIENIGDPDLFSQALYSMAMGGRMVTAGAHGGGQVTLDVNFLYQNRITIVGAPVENPSHYDTGFNAYLSGHYSANIARRFPLSETAAAHAFAESPEAIGKTIIEPHR